MTNNNNFQVSFGVFEKPYLCNGCLNRGSVVAANAPQIIYLATVHSNEIGTGKTINNYCFYCAVNIVGGWMQKLYAIQGQREYHKPYKDYSKVEKKS